MTEVRVANGQFTFPALAKVPASRLTWISLAVLEYDKPEFASKKPTHTCSISHRSPSIKPSMQSSRSRITLVGYDEELEDKLDTAYGTTHKFKESTWLDRVLGVFCIRRRGRVSSRMTVMPTKPEQDEVCGLTVGGRGVFTDPSHRATAALRISYPSMFFRAKRTRQDISYRRKPNVRWTPETFKGTWYPKHLLLMFSDTLSPAFSH
jgi:hypothetical protein